MSFFSSTTSTFQGNNVSSLSCCQKKTRKRPHSIISGTFKTSHSDIRLEKKRIKPSIDSMENRSNFSLACKNGDEELAQEFLDLGMNPNATDGDESELSPLHYASMNGHIEIVELLLKSGAEDCVFDKANLSPLHYACLGGYYEVAQSLISHNKQCLYLKDPNDPFNSFEPIYFAIIGNHFDVVDLIVNAGLEL